MSISPKDHYWLSRAVELARVALDHGDAPYGSVLVSADGTELFADHNRISGGDETQHPEFAIARWSAAHLTIDERSTSTVYTSGEHCSMCAAAHGWVGLGRIVYAASSTHIATWNEELGHEPSSVKVLPIDQVIDGALIDGPDEQLVPAVRELFNHWQQ